MTSDMGMRQGMQQTGTALVLALGAAAAGCATAGEVGPYAVDAGAIVIDSSALGDSDGGAQFIMDSDSGTPAVGTDAAPPVTGTDAAAPAGPAPCVEGDFNAVDPGTGGCFMFFEGPASWSAASAACAALGPTAHLATSAGAGENDTMAHLAALDDTWVGATDAASEGTFAWETGEPLAYVNWRIGEPNDSNGEDCMIVEGDNAGLWDDRDCGNTYPYLCERE